MNCKDMCWSTAVWGFLAISLSADIIPLLEMKEEKILGVVDGAGYLAATNEM